MRMTVWSSLALAGLGAFVMGCGDGGAPSGGAGGVGGSSVSGGSGGMSTAGAGGMSTAGSGGMSTAGSGGTAGGGGSIGGGGSGGVGGCAPVGPETCGSPADEDCDGTECGLWARVYGSTHGTQFPSRVVTTATGDVFVNGGFGTFLPNQFPSVEFAGQTITADAKNEAFLAKLSGAGGELWIKKLPRLGPIAPMPDGGVAISIAFFGTINLGGQDISTGSPALLGVAIARFGPDGSHLWSRGLVGPTAVGLANITADGNGRIVVQGDAAGTADYDGQPALVSPGMHDYLMALDQDGALQWIDAFSIPANTIIRARQLAVDSNGDTVIVGAYYGDYSVGGAGLPTSEFGFNTFVARFDSAGAHLQSRRFCRGTCDLSGLSAGEGGEVYVTGAVEASSYLDADPVVGTKFYVAKLSALDNIAWKHFLVPQTWPDGQGMPQVTATAGGGATVAVELHDQLNLGFASYLPKGTHDIAVVRFESNGSPLWSRSFGAPGADLTLGFGAIADQPGGALTLGAIWKGAGGVDLGTGPLQVFGEGDMLLATLAP